MIKQNIFKFNTSKDNNEFKNIENKTINCICECHKFIKKEYDASSDSLPEIRKFNNFFKFFLDYLRFKTEYKDDYKNINKLYLSALNITIYLCYYLRIAYKNIRKKLENLLKKYFDNENFLEMPNKEVSYISSQFIIDNEKGITLNRSLKKNLFTSFVCIVNRIPLIIVGKPREGKSLAIRTINQTMKGIYSNSDWFKQYSQLYIYNYQGSETTTSQGIIEIFYKVKNQIKKSRNNKNNSNYENKEKFIVMVFFDEMELVERSPNNPLKVIHSELEYDNNEYKNAFVGISNWTIDQSKMNKCLTLSKPDPGKEDLVSNANTIAKALDDTLYNNYKFFIESLAFTYFNYKNEINNNKLIQNFHGNKDFYHLIKCAMRELKKYQNDIRDKNRSKFLARIGLMSLTRNFGGLSYSLKNIKLKFKNLFFNYNDETIYSYNILECIKSLII